jgi:MOSC domain-containing protein YiiM
MTLPIVVAVSRAERHVICKTPVDVIRLRSGLGVERDAHSGTTVQHRHDRRRDPARTNRRQVHLIGAELIAELVQAGFTIAPGDLGENITTRGIDVTSLPADTRLRLGDQAILELTGLRAPCVLLDRIAPGLCAATSVMLGSAKTLRHGVMAIVLADGDVRAGDRIEIELPPAPHRRLSIV